MGGCIHGYECASVALADLPHCKLVGESYQCECRNGYTPIVHKNYCVSPELLTDFESCAAVQEKVNLLSRAVQASEDSCSCSANQRAAGLVCAGEELSEWENCSCSDEICTCTCNLDDSKHGKRIT